MPESSTARVELGTDGKALATTSLTDNYRKHTSASSLQRKLIGRFTDTLVREVRTLAPVKILDVGCGEGFMLERLRQEHLGVHLEGVDILERALQLGRIAHTELLLTRGDLYHLDYPDNSFDLVLCTEVLEHLDDPRRALSEMTRVSSMHCVISVPREPLFRLGNLIRGKNVSRLGNDIEHVQHWSSGRASAFVGQSLHVEKVLKPLPWTLIVAEKRAK